MTTLDSISRQIADLSQALVSVPGAQADRKMEAFEGLLNEISTALSDILGTFERRAAAEDEGKELQAIQALTDAIKGLKLTAPAVTVQVNPTPIENHVTVPAPVVTVTTDKGRRVARWEIDHQYLHGRIDKSVLTPVYDQPSN